MTIYTGITNIKPKFAMIKAGHAHFEVAIDSKDKIDVTSEAVEL